MLKSRPKGQGLGAEEKSENKLKLAAGDFVVILSGEHKDLTGVVVGIQETKAAV